MALSGILLGASVSMRKGRILRRTAVASALLLALAFPGAAVPQALAALEREKEREKLRSLDSMFKELNDCGAVVEKIVDVLRHGWAITHQDEIKGKRAANQQLGRALFGGVAGTLQGAGAVLPPIPRARGGLEIEPPSRKKYRQQMEEEFREWVFRGGRRSCTDRARDLAWSYAPAIATECVDLPSRPIDTLRTSGEFYGHDRSAVRLEVLHRYRGAVRSREWSGTCAEYAEALAADAWVLDP